MGNTLVDPVWGQANINSYGTYQLGKPDKEGDPMSILLAEDDWPYEPFIPSFWWKVKHRMRQVFFR